MNHEAREEERAADRALERRLRRYSLTGPDGTDRIIILLLLDMLGSRIQDAVTKTDLLEMEKRIMSAISDFAAKVKAHNDRIETAVEGLSGDVDELKKKIEELQNSPGAISEEDQKLLDEIEGNASKVADKLEALNSLTPPATPPPTE